MEKIIELLNNIKDSELFWISLAIFVTVTIALLAIKSANKQKSEETELEPGSIIYGTIINVSDGDTADLRNDKFERLRIRFYGIDAPEIAHEGTEAQPFGDESKSFLNDLIYRQDIKLLVEGIDKYKRALGTVFCGEKYKTNVNLKMVEEGLAIAYPDFKKNPKYFAKLTKAQEKAQKKGLKIWSLKEKLETPAEFRKRTKKRQS